MTSKRARRRARAAARGHGRTPAATPTSTSGPTTGDRIPEESTVTAPTSAAGPQRAPFADGKFVPYAVAVGMTGTVGQLIRITIRSVPDEVFASVAVPVHRTPGVWVLAERPPVKCGRTCGLYAVKRRSRIVFAYLHEHDGELPPVEQRRGDMDAPDGPPRPMGTRTLSWGRRQYSWSTAPDTSPIVGEPDSQRLPETDAQTLQVVLMEAEPDGTEQWRQVDGGTGSGKAPEVWVKSFREKPYARVVVDQDLHAPRGEREPKPPKPRQPRARKQRTYGVGEAPPVRP